MALASLTHVGTHRGLVNPVAEAGLLCRGSGVPSLSSTPARASASCRSTWTGIGCDVLTGTGRKWLRGPRGTGLLYVRSAFAERLRPPGIDGGSALWDDRDHYRLQSGALRFSPSRPRWPCASGSARPSTTHSSSASRPSPARVAALGEELRSRLRTLDGVTVHDGGRERCGIVTFTVDGYGPQAVKAAAGSAGVNVSVTEAAAARLDLGAPGPTTVVRASPHYYNTEDELGRLVDVLGDFTGP